MAVLPMKKITIAGMKKDRKTVLEALQRMEAVEIIDADEEETKDTAFSKADTSEQRTQFERMASRIDDALEILNQYAPDANSGLKAKLAGKEALSASDFGTVVRSREQTLNYANEIVQRQKEITEAKAEGPRIETQIESLMPWMKMDLPLDFKGTAKTAALIGTVPEAVTEDSVAEAIYQYAPDITGVNVDVISSDDEQSCLMVVCLKKDAPQVDEALRRMEFARPPVSSRIPSEEIAALRQQMQDNNKKIEELQSSIASFAEHREDLKRLYDYFVMRADKYQVIDELAQSNRTFILTGYVPAEQADEVVSALTSRCELAVDLADPDPDEDVPVKLHNPKLAEPVEGVVENYSMPGKNDVDPTTPVACFYYFLFGMMLSDACYGAIICIITGILLKKHKNMDGGLQRSLKMFFLCGLGTILSGILFGSYFGDLIPTIGSLMGKDIKIWSWIDPLHQPMTMMTFSFTVGIIHIFTALGILMYSLIKHGHVLDAIYDGVFWYMLVGGLIVFGLSYESFCGMLGFDAAVVSSSAGSVGGWIALIGAIGILLFGGRDSRNWGKRLAKGAYALYGITGYLSDILSYSRLMALGLATSVISSVFNTLGAMSGNVILFIIIALIGHVLNILINMLGAYVHSNRLTFVEFFGKFYEGGGRKFKPFGMNTKYIKVTK
ncbi:MAG: V-type ATP synthase subunit I [Lachnospiraceae bacterium]|jgi:V/A-type H+-transporting ATPase subunit I